MFAISVCRQRLSSCSWKITTIRTHYSVSISALCRVEKKEHHCTEKGPLYWIQLPAFNLLQQGLPLVCDYPTRMPLLSR